MYQQQNSGYLEQLVSRKMTPARVLGALAISFFGFFLSVLVAAVGITGILKDVIGEVGAYFLRMVSLLLAAGGIYLTYRLVNNFRKEYEYTLTAGEMDVDCIIAKSKRSRLVTFTLSEVEKGGKYTDAVLREQVDACVDAASDRRDPDARYVIVKTKKKGRTLIIFTPNERIRTAMRSYLPRHIILD